MRFRVLPRHRGGMPIRPIPGRAGTGRRRDRLRYRRRSDVPPGNRAGAVEDIRRRVDVAIQGQTAVSAAKLPYAERHGLHAAAAPSGSSITRCTDVRSAVRTMRACRTTPPGITANRMSPTPFTDSAYRLPLRRMAGFHTSNECTPRCLLLKRGNPGFPPACTRRKNALNARSRRCSGLRWACTERRRNDSSSPRMIVGDLHWS